MPLAYDNLTKFINGNNYSFSFNFKVHIFSLFLARCPSRTGISPLEGITSLRTIIDVLCIIDLFSNIIGKVSFKIHISKIMLISQPFTDCLTKVQFTSMPYHADKSNYTYN